MNESREPQLKLSPKMIMIGAALLVVYLLLKPTLESQFGWDLPGFTEKPQVAQHDGAQGSKETDLEGTLASIQDSIQVPSESPKAVATQEVAPAEDVIAMNRNADEQPLTTSPKSEPTPPKTTGPKGTASKNTKPTPNIATKPPLSNNPTSKSNPTSNVATKPPIKTNPTPPAQPALGQLTELSGKVYESTAGLRFTPGSIDKHRLMHVMKHAEDNLEKPVHGVFSVEKKEILVLLDQAWELAKKGKSKQVRIEEEHGRTAYTIDMRKPIGYVGGQTGKRRDNPKCYKIKLVLEGTEVITAYPTQ